LFRKSVSMCKAFGVYQQSSQNECIMGTVNDRNVVCVEMWITALHISRLANDEANISAKEIFNSVFTVTQRMSLLCLTLLTFLQRQHTFCVWCCDWWL